MHEIDLLPPAEQIVMVLQRIYDMGMTTSSGGNISIIEDNGDIWVSPSGVDKGNLTAKDMCCIKPDGSIIGLHKPSSEYPFHKAIYEVRSDIKAIVHAHSSSLVAFSTVHKIPKVSITPKSYQECGLIGYCGFAIPGSDELGRMVADAFKNKKYLSIIMENHGVVVGGKFLSEAYARFENIEYTAETIVHAKAIGEANYLEKDQLLKGATQSPGNSGIENHGLHPDEDNIRENICRIAARACKQKLLFGTMGTISVRLNDQKFLITPPNVPLWKLKPENLIKVKASQFAKNQNSSDDFLKHSEIYRQNPQINSIIFAYPPNLMAYGISDVELSVRTIPESYFTLLDIPKLPFDSSYIEKDSIPVTFGKEVRAVLVQNDCFIVTGNQLLETFDCLEVAEFSAKSLRISKQLGTMTPMDQDAIDALHDKYVK